MKESIAISRKSNLTGVTSRMVMLVDRADLDSWEAGNGNIQDIMPYLSPDEREFLMTGITPEEWDDMFKETVARSKDLD